MAYDDAPLNTMVDYNQVVLAQQLDDGIGTLNKIVEGQDVLAKTSDVLAQNEAEGVDPTTAQMASVAVESICQKLGISNSRVMPSLESFESNHTRASATSIAQEGIGQVLNAIYDGIIKAIKYVIAKFSEFMRAYLSGSSYTDRIIRQLRAEIASGTLKEPTGDDKGISDPDLYNAFYENKHGTSPDTVILVSGNTLKNYRVLEEYAHLFEAYVKKFHAVVKDLHKAVDDIGQGADTDVFGILKTAYDDMNKTLTSYLKSKMDKGSDRDLPKYVQLPDGASKDVYTLPHSGYGFTQAMVEVDVNGDATYGHMKRVEYVASDSHEPGIVPYPNKDQAAELMKIFEAYSDIAKKGMQKSASSFVSAMAELTNEITVIKRTIDATSFDEMTELTIRSMGNKLGDLLITISNDYSTFYVKGVVETDHTFNKLGSYLTRSFNSK